MRHLPYYVGGFMLLPLLIWLVLWSVFFPGPNHGLDVPLTAAMLATSMPLVLWFFLANLGFLANSIGGTNEYEKPSQGLVRGIVALLPSSALIIGLISLPVLFLQGQPTALLGLPLATGVAIFFAIRYGERARGDDRARSQQRTPAQPAQAIAPLSTSNAPGLGHRIGGFALRLLYAVPLLGWMIEDAVKGRESAKLFFALNCLFALLAAIAFFGYPALIVFALVMVPVVFAGIFWTTRA
ncbi:hypothetical protein [Pelagibius sp.]|uniref:hypothetical protein n=1 Tax=Pelagibius sp. TaxID=1931238 RepID=UPI003BB03673